MERPPGVILRDFRHNSGMNGQAYAAARTVAPKVHAYFARHLAEARERGVVPLASLPDEDAIGSMIDAAFWTSLRREEGYVPRISLAFLSPAEADHPLTLDRPLPLSANAWRASRRRSSARGFISASRRRTAASSPGVGDDARHSGAVPGAGSHRAWPAGHQASSRRRIGEPSTSRSSKGIRSSWSTSARRSCPTARSSADAPAGFESSDLGVDSTNVLVQLAVSMRATGRGGALLVVPPNTDSWRESIVWPALYGVSPAFAELQMLNQTPPGDARERYIWQEALARAVNAMAGSTAVDGATVIASRYGTARVPARPSRGGRDSRRSHRSWSPSRSRAARRTSCFRSSWGGTRHQYCAVRARSARFGGAGGVARRAIHDLRVVANPVDGACPSRRGAAPVALLRIFLKIPSLGLGALLARRETVGSIRAARRAGIQLARSAIADNNSGIAANVSGSTASMPKSSVCMKCVSRRTPRQAERDADQGDGHAP